MSVVPFDTSSLTNAASTIQFYWKRLQQLRNQRLGPDSLAGTRRAVRAREAQEDLRRSKRRKLTPAVRSVPLGVPMVKSKFPKRRRKSTVKKGSRKLFAKASSKRVKPFKKRAKVKPVNKKGSVFTVVSSNVLKPTAGDRRNAIVVGHTSAGFARMYLCGFRGVLKLMAQKLRLDFKSWDQEVYVDRGNATVTTPMASLVWSYRVLAGGDLILDSINVAAGMTWDGLAVLWANRVKDVINNDVTTVGPIREQYEFVQIWWQYQAQNAITVSEKEQPAFMMNANEINLSFECSSKLSVQNRTAAIAVGVGDVSVSNRNDIAANPLVGKSYEMTKGYSQLKFIPDNVGGGAGGEIVGNSQTGLIYFDPTTFDADVARQYNAIPYHTTFKNVKSSSKVLMSPGNVKLSYVTYKKSFSLNYFIKRVRDNIRNVTDATSVVTYAGLQNNDLAVGRFFCLKKSLDDGTGAEPYASIAFQVDSKIFVHATQRNKFYTTVYREVV